MPMQIKDVIFLVVKENKDLELSQLLKGSRVTRDTLLRLLQKLEHFSKINLSAYINFVETSTEEGKIIDLYNYLGYYIMQAEIERAKKYLENMFEGEDTV
jgi:hypothetical protein